MNARKVICIHGYTSSKSINVVQKLKELNIPKSRVDADRKMRGTRRIEMAFYRGIFLSVYLGY